MSTTTMTQTRTGFTQVNLLPPETKERQRSRRQTSIIVAAGMAVVAVLALFSFVQAARVSDLKDKVAAQNTQNGTLTAQITTLQPYETLRESVTSNQKLVDQALSGDVSWSNVLHELTTVLPPQVWVTSISATTSQGEAIPTEGSTTPATGIIGSMTFQGDSLDTDGASLWLVRLAQNSGWVNPWMSSLTKTPVGSKPVFQFTSSVDLDGDVLSKRGGGSR